MVKQAQKGKHSVQERVLLFLEDLYCDFNGTQNILMNVSPTRLVKRHSLHNDFVVAAKNLGFLRYDEEQKKHAWLADREPDAAMAALIYEEGCILGVSKRDARRVNKHVKLVEQVEHADAADITNRLYMYMKSICQVLQNAKAGAPLSVGKRLLEAKLPFATTTALISLGFLSKTGSNQKTRYKWLTSQPTYADAVIVRQKMREFESARNNRHKATTPALTPPAPAAVVEAVVTKAEKTVELPLTLDAKEDAPVAKRKRRVSISPIKGDKRLLLDGEYIRHLRFKRRASCVREIHHKYRSGKWIPQRGQLRILSFCDKFHITHGFVAALVDPVHGILERRKDASGYQYRLLHQGELTDQRILAIVRAHDEMTDKVKTPPQNMGTYPAPEKDDADVVQNMQEHYISAATEMGTAERLELFALARKYGKLDIAAEILHKEADLCWAAKDELGALRALRKLDELNKA